MLKTLTLLISTGRFLPSERGIADFGTRNANHQLLEQAVTSMASLSAAPCLIHALRK